MAVRFTTDIIPAQYVERLSDALASGAEYGFYTLGGAVTTSSGLTVAVAAVNASTYVINGTVVGTAYSANTVTLSAADATNPRIDIVAIKDDGTVAATAGTPAASPVPPDIGADELHLAQINVAANQTTIASGDITDMRQELPLRRVIIRKSADESVQSDVTLSDDSELLFAIPPSTNWVGNLNMYVTTPAAADFQFSVTVPTSATLLVNGLATGPTIDNDGQQPISAIGDIYRIALRTSGTAVQLTGTSAIVAWWIDCNIVVENSTTAGNIAVQWSQVSSTASDTTVKEGSSLVAYQVA